ncbi:MAG: hypothetical protein AB7H81_26390 [Vicinamibacterales bacterium]
MTRIAALRFVSAMAVSATAHAQSARLVLMRPEVLTASCPWQGCDPGPARLTRYDAATGSVLPEREYPIDPWDFEFVRRLDLDPHTGRVYVEAGEG